MLKGLARIAAVLLGVVLIAFIIITLSLDYIVKSSIETTASDILQTSVTVGSVSISPISGEGSIEDIRIANPEGYEGDEALTIGSVQIEIEPFSILSDTVHVRLLNVQSLAISYQQRLTGGNLTELLNNARSYSGPTESESEKEMIIDRFLMENTNLTVSTTIENIETIEVELPRVEQTDIGRRGESGISGTVRLILERILQEAAEEGLKRVLEEGGQNLLDRAGNALKDLFN